MFDTFALLFGAALPGLPPPMPVVSAPATVTASMRQPVIGAGSFLLMDAGSGQVLLARGATTPRPIASLTKLMTVLVAREVYAPEELLTVGRGAAAVEPAKLYLPAGATIRVQDLLAACLIRSANDAALTLADNYPGGRMAFVARMNAKAREMGLTGTHFADPVGLDATGYSTAEDIGTLSLAVLRDPLLAGFAAEKDGVAVAGGRAIPYHTTNELMDDPSLSMLGLKTGTTDEAGECLAALAQVGRRKVLAIVLASPARAREAKALLTFAKEAIR